MAQFKSYADKLFIQWVLESLIRCHLPLTGGLSAPADPIRGALRAPRHSKHTDTNEHKHSRNANPLVHIRYTVFSSCFSSAFPNG